MKLKIALVSREYPPGYGGGIGTYARHVAPALAAQGCRVHVVTHAHEARPAREEHGPITVHRVAMGDGTGSAIMRGSLEAGRMVAHLARCGQVDIVEFADYEGAAWASQLFRAPNDLSPRIVVHFHSPTELNLTLNGIDTTTAPRHAGMTVAAERWSIALADGRCAPSRFMAEWATAQYDLPEPPAVIPYAMPPIGGDLPAPTAKRLLYVGRLERRKGVDVLARAWARVAGSQPEWQLRLVGSDTGTAPGGGSMRAYLESLLPAEAARRTTFVERVPAEALEREYADALVCVTPSRWENFPNTCLEAMRAGRAIIVSDQGGMREMLGEVDGGTVAAAGDVDAWTTALASAMATPRERLLEQGAVGRVRIEGLCAPSASQRCASSSIVASWRRGDAVCRPAHAGAEWICGETFRRKREVARERGRPHEDRDDQP